MENVEKKECECADGKCVCNSSMWHMHGCHGRYHLVKIILKLFIIIIIFWCGFKLGVITGSIQTGYGHANFGMMRSGGYALPNSGGGVPTGTPAPVAQ